MGSTKPEEGRNAGVTADEEDSITSWSEQGPDATTGETSDSKEEEAHFSEREVEISDPIAR